MNYHLELDPEKVLECYYDNVHYYELWKPIDEYESTYQISTFGRVLSLKWNKKRILQAGISGRGYLKVGLSKNSITKGYYIHTLVSVMFLNHVSNGNKGLVIDHKDDIKINNFYKNLQSISNRDNLIRGIKNKTSKYTGVYLVMSSGAWISVIAINKTTIHLIHSKSEEKAHCFYQIALKNKYLFLGNKKDFRLKIKSIYNSGR